MLNNYTRTPLTNAATDRKVAFANYGKHVSYGGAIHLYRSRPSRNGCWSAAVVVQLVPRQVMKIITRIYWKYATSLKMVGGANPGLEVSPTVCGAHRGQTNQWSRCWQIFLSRQLIFSVPQQVLAYLLQGLWLRFCRAMRDGPGWRSPKTHHHVYRVPFCSWHACSIMKHQHTQDRSEDCQKVKFPPWKRWIKVPIKGWMSQPLYQFD